jgi:hypothetical protein
VGCRLGGPDLRRLRPGRTHPLMTEDDDPAFYAAVERWDAEHADENPMIDQELESIRRTTIVASALENYASGMRVNRSMANVVWSPDEAINVCADSVVLETGCRRIDAMVVASLIADAIQAIDINWPTF